MKINNYLTCEVEISEDQNLSKDLEHLALGLVKNLKDYKF